VRYIKLTYHYTVVVMFKRVGNAPMLKQKKFKLSSKVKFQYVVDFLRKQLRYTNNEPLVSFTSCVMYNVIDV